MALDPARLTAGINAAIATAAALQGPASAQAMAAGISAAIMVELHAATVSPDGVTPLTCAAAPGPVAGTGKLV